MIILSIHMHNQKSTRIQFSFNVLINFVVFYSHCSLFQKLIFEDGGEIFSLWKSPPVDIYIKIYLWNITNSEAFLSGKEKMQLEEVGPYVYRYVFSLPPLVLLHQNLFIGVETHSNFLSTFS